MKSILLAVLCILPFSTKGQDFTVLDIQPSSYLSGVTKNIQLTCRPPERPQIARLVSMQITRESSRGGGTDPVVSFLTSAAAPQVEPFGVLLNASASATYDAGAPKKAVLRVDLPLPKDNAAGTYTCSVGTLDSHGLLHHYTSHKTSLTSFYLNGSVPLFYQGLLVELRRELDTLNSDLHKVTVDQTGLGTVDNSSQQVLSSIADKKQKVTGSINEVNNGVAAADNKVTLMNSELNRLRSITPEVPVNFYAFYSPRNGAVANNANIVFNSLEQHTDSSYSTSTGVFTTPVNGTYLFRTGVTGDSISHSASIVVNDVPVASLVSSDDYSVHQATASAILQLHVNDTVRVVKKSGSSVYGYEPNNAANNHITYFMGALLW